MTERGILFSAPMIRAILAGRKTVTRRIVKDSRTEYGEAFAVTCDRQLEAAPIQNGPMWLTEQTARGRRLITCPYGQPGDRLWVRETWRAEELDRDLPHAPVGVDGIRYRADDVFRPIENTTAAADLWMDAYDNGKHGAKWRPSIFMPRWASRITLDVVSVRVERLHEITEEDAVAEGCEADPGMTSWCAYDMEHEGMIEGFGHEGAPEVSERYPFVRKRPPMLQRSARDAYRLLWMQINGVKSWDEDPWCWRIEFSRRVA